MSIIDFERYWSESTCYVHFSLSLSTRHVRGTNADSVVVRNQLRAIPKRYGLRFAGATQLAGWLSRTEAQSLVEELEVAAGLVSPDWVRITYLRLTFGNGEVLLDFKHDRLSLAA